jgi:hypothetical protein
MRSINRVVEFSYPLFGPSRRSATRGRNGSLYPLRNTPEVHLQIVEAAERLTRLYVANGSHC